MPLVRQTAPPSRLQRPSVTAVEGVSVTVSEPEAVAAGAMWSLDGGTNWNESGATVQDLAVKTYAITFLDVAGFVAPAATNVALAAGQAANLGATYDEIEPVGADCIRSQGFDGLDVNPWSWNVAYLNNSGLATNESFGAAAATSAGKVLVGSNAVRLVGSTNGAVNPAVVFANVDLANYTNVTLTVPFAAAGPDSGDDLHVSVSYDGGATWSPSAYGTQIADGYNGLDLEYGTLSDTNRQPQGTPYVLAIADVRTQLMVRVTFFDASANNSSDYYYLDEIQLKGQAGAAPPATGALSVTLQPAAAVSAGAQWRVDGGAWRASGAVATGLTAGAHVVSFGAATGWTAPADVATAVTNGITNSFAATYVEEPDTNSLALIDEPFDVTPAVPAGWIFSGITTNYPATYYGRAVPSTKFDSTNDAIVSPAFSGGTNLQFWMRGVTSAGVGEFWVEQAIGGNWSILCVVTNPASTGAIYSLALPETATQLRFTWKKASNNVALDDVIVNGMWLSGADSDGDGMDDHGEYVAGTDPQTESSVLALDPIATNMTATANLIFRWPSATGRTYSIWRATNVLGPYTQHVAGISANAPTNSLTNAAPADLGEYFYGIGVQRTP